jgi:hypothetical protein
MTDIKEILQIVKTTRDKISGQLYAPLTMHQAGQMADEIERLTKCLHKANANHEEFERKWYLALGEIEDMKEQKDESAQDWYLISLRDEFAKAALQGSIAADEFDNLTMEAHVRYAWQAADAMMKERNKHD